MSLPFSGPVNFSFYPPEGLRAQNLATDRTFASGEKGAFWVDAAGNWRVNDGTNIVTLRSTDTPITNGDIASNAAIAMSKLATNPLARANHTGTQTASTISDFNSVAVTANAAAIAANSTGDRARGNHTGTQASSTISDLAATVKAYKLNEFAAPTGAVNANNQQITNVPDPLTDTAAANKRYVDSAVQGLKGKTSVKAASNQTVTGDLSYLFEKTSATGLVMYGGTTVPVDGVALALGDRILIIDPINATDAVTVMAEMGGIYDVTSIAPNNVSLARSSDSDTIAELISAFVFVQSGTVFKDTGWLCIVDGGTLGTTDIDWTQFSSAGQITAGTGLTKTGNTISIANGGVGATQLASNAITSVKIADGAVITSKIPDEAITGAKLGDSVYTQNGSWGYGLGMKNPDALSVYTDNLTIGHDMLNTEVDTRGTTISKLKVVEGGIGYVQLADDAIDDSKIENRGISGQSIHELLTQGGANNNGIGWYTNTAIGVMVDNSTVALQTRSSFTDARGMNVKEVAVKTGGIGAAQLADGAVSLTGTKTSGVLPISKGGTGATSAAAVRAALGVPGKYSNGAVHAAGASIVITAGTHGLGAGRDKIVQTLIESTGEVVLSDTGVAANGDVAIVFGATQAANTIRVTIIG